MGDNLYQAVFFCQKVITCHTVTFFTPALFCGTGFVINLVHIDVMM